MRRRFSEREADWLDEAIKESSRSRIHAGAGEGLAQRSGRWQIGLMHESKHESAAAAMRQINQAWLNGRVDDLAPLVHSEIVTVVPGFAAKIQGHEMFLAGFRDFCGSATIEKFKEHDQQVDVAGGLAGDA